MLFIVIAVHNQLRIVRILIVALTVKTEILIICRMLPHVFQSDQNLKGTSRRIESLRRTIQQVSAGVAVAYQGIPVRKQRIGIISRLGYHSQDFSGSGFHTDHRSALVSQRIAYRLL